MPSSVVTFLAPPKGRMYKEPQPALHRQFTTDSFIHRPAHSIMNITRNWRLPLIGAIRTESVLLLMTLLAVVFGTLFGILLNPIVRERELDPLYLVYLKFPGDLFMRMLKMIIVPLVISSNVSAIASLNARAARTLTLMSVLYYISTTLIAVMLGVFLAMTIQPGIPRHYNTTWIQPKSPKLINASVNVMESILDLARNMVPENLFRATFQKSSWFILFDYFIKSFFKPVSALLKTLSD